MKRGKRAAVITIIVMERSGKVFMEIMKKCNYRDSRERDCNEAALMYMDKWKGCNSLIVSIYRHLNVDHKYSSKKESLINGVVRSGAWRKNG